MLLLLSGFTAVPGGIKNSPGRLVRRWTGCSPDVPYNPKHSVILWRSKEKGAGNGERITSLPEENLRL